MGELSIEDISKNLPTAARSVEFESARGNKAVRKTLENLDVDYGFLLPRQSFIHCVCHPLTF